MLYKLIRWSRQVRIWLGGRKFRDEKFKLFQLAKPIPVEEFRGRLIPLCYQYNFVSHTYRDQVWTVRKLDKDGIHQYHLRYYSDGWVTGHWEFDPMIEPRKHLASEDLRRLTEAEKEKIRRAL